MNYETEHDILGYSVSDIYVVIALDGCHLYQRRRQHGNLFSFVLWVKPYILCHCRCFRRKKPEAAVVFTGYFGYIVFGGDMDFL